MAHLTNDPSTQDSHSKYLTSLMPNTNPFHATPNAPRKILQTNCTTGLLTHSLAKLYPTAQLIGLSPKSVDTSLHGRLPNLMYIKGTLEEMVEREDMLFWSGTFDYIFQRGGPCLEEDVRMCANLLGEGGWLEVQEVGLSVYSGGDERCLSEGWEWMRSVEEGAKGKGVDVDRGDKLKGWFEGIGLVDVEEVVYKVPLGGPVVGDDGEQRNLQQMIKTYQDLVEKFCSKGKSAEDIIKLKETVAETLGKCSEHDFTKMHVVIGKKPSS